MQATNWVYEGMLVLKVKVISLPYIFQVLYVLCFTRPRYQRSVYRTIGSLVKTCDYTKKNLFISAHKIKLLCLEITFMFSLVLLDN